MAIDFQAQSKYSLFEDFAAKAASESKDKAIVASARHGMTVVAKAHRDYVGHIARSAASKAQNNDVRELFKESVLGMFGVRDVEKLPPAVRDAMKLEDYGKGKPLTARRILAVKTAADGFFAEKAKSVEAEAVRQGLKLDDETRALVDAAVRDCFDDADVLAVVTANIKDIVFKNGTAEMRDADGIRAKVVAIAANVDELRQATKGEPKVFAAARDFLGTMKGAIIPPGVIRDLVATVGTLDLGALKRLGPDAKAQDLQDASVQFSAVLDEAMEAVGANDFDESIPEDRRDKDFYHDFLSCLIFAKSLGDGVSSIRATRDALETDTARKLATYYRDGAAALRGEKEANPLFFDTTRLEDASVEIRSDTSRLGQGDKLFLAEQLESHLKLLKEMKFALDLVCGKHRPIVPIAEGAPQREVDADGTLLGRLYDKAVKKMASEQEAYMREAVKGDGTSAGELRFVIGRKLKELRPHKPAEAVRNLCQDAVKDLMCDSVFDGCKAIAADKGRESFQAARAGIVAKLPNGVVLSDDFHEARRQIASFVTGGKKNLFQKLTPSEQNKVYIVMSLLTKGMAQAAFEAPALALFVKPSGVAMDPDEYLPAFAMKGDPKTDRIEVSVEFENGDLKLSFKGHRDIVELQTRPGYDAARDRLPPSAGMVRQTPNGGVASLLLEDGGLLPTGVNAGSTFDVECVVKIEAGEFGRMADDGDGKFLLDTGHVTCTDFKMDARVNGDVPRPGAPAPRRRAAVASRLPAGARAPDAPKPAESVAPPKAPAPGAKGKKARDFIGNVGRSEEAKAANEEVRANFMAAVLDQFSVEKAEDLPEPIQKAMRLKDYGKGKPLSQHRIDVVSEAVADYFEPVAKAMAAAAERNGLEVDDVVEELIHVAVFACKNVKGALDYLLEYTDYILMDHQRNQLRTDDAIMAIISEIRDIEMRNAATKGRANGAE